MLCQFTANASGKTVVAGPDEATAIGNITVQLIAMGAASTLEEAKSILAPASIVREYKPQDHALWDTHYRDYLRLLERSRI